MSPDEQLKLFKDNLKKLRRKKKMSYEMLSIKTGMSKACLWNIESPTKGHNPSVRSALKIAKALNCNIGDFFKEEDSIENILGGKKV